MGVDNSTYILTCTNASGVSVSASATLITTLAAPPAPGTVPPPTVTISASPKTISVGQPVTLTWSSANATGCLSSGAWWGGGEVAPVLSSGSFTDSEPNGIGTATYTITCTGIGGTASASAAVTVTPAVTSSTAATSDVNAQTAIASQSLENLLNQLSALLKLL
jgi:hypothetical protein